MQFNNPPQILDYLQTKGIPYRQHGTNYFCSSPFSNDSNWSLCVYPRTNSFFDWSNGFGGDVWRLISLIEGKKIHELKSSFNYEAYQSYNKKQYSEPKRTQKPFDYTRYLNTNSEERKKIKEYADSRCLEDGNYEYCFYNQPLGGEWERIPAVGFLHVDENLKPCGIKFRKLTDDNPRFSARGKLGMYILQSPAVLGTDTVYVVEGEANANSLAIYLKSLSKKVCVISFGGVSLCGAKLPTTLKNYSIKLIIDYDGNEDLYQQRLKNYESMNAEPIKLILPKGEDINSLHMKNKLYLIENLL